MEGRTTKIDKYSCQLACFGINAEWLFSRSPTLILNGLQNLKSHFADCGKRNKHLLPPVTGPSAMFLSAPHTESRIPAGLSGFAHFPPAVQSLLLILSQVSHCRRGKKKPKPKDQLYFRHPFRKCLTKWEGNSHLFRSRRKFQKAAP